MVQRVIFLKNDKANLSERETARQRDEWEELRPQRERERGVGGAKATQIDEWEGLSLYRRREGGANALQSNEWEGLRHQREGRMGGAKPTPINE